MVTKNNHTNIILVNIPYRYDTANTNTVNEGIEKFNKKLEELIKASGWNKSDGSILEDKSLNRVTTRNRKLPVTRSKDFLR